MVAYSYKKRFVNPIRAGLYLLPIMDDRVLPLGALKLQTIRADRKRHARPGEEIQHYCGMRTKGCFFIGRAQCTSVRSIVLTLKPKGSVAIGDSTEPQAHYAGGGLDTFARMDGFEDWNEMLSFWDVPLFIGVLIEWKPLT